MPPVRVQLGLYSYQDRTLPATAQRLVNLYAERKPASAKTEYTLHGTPGLKPWATVGSGPIRGMLPMGPLLFVVSGDEVYKVDSAGASTLLGTATGTGMVSMAQNGTQVCIVDDNDVFVADSSSVSNAAYTNCIGVAVQDGYGLLGFRNTQQFFITGINDFLDFDPLAYDFVLVNALPDNLVAIVNANRETWLFGERSAQVYYDSGDADFPFTRNAAGVITRGCGSAKSVAEHQGVVFWLGDDLRVYVSQGYRPQPISTHAIDKAISEYVSPNTAVGFVYSQEGHVFYVLSFNETTWVYDVSTGLWHERESDGFTNWRVRTYAWQFNKHIAGDSVNGQLYELDLDTYDDDGDVIRRQCTTPPIHAETSRAVMTSFSLDAEAGVGLITGQGSDPQVSLQWSDDGGRTWSSELWRDLGGIGRFGDRVRWNRLGQFRQRCLRIAISDPVKVALLDAWAEVEVGDP